MEVDALHSFVVLNYIGAPRKKNRGSPPAALPLSRPPRLPAHSPGLFKLAKKWNKVAGGAPGARVTVLPLLLSSPLLSSRSLQLLFQRTSKLRFEGSAHGGIGGAQPPAAAPAAPPAPPASSPIRVGRRASSGKTALLTTLFPSSGGASFSPSKSGTTTLALSRSSDALAPPPHAPLSQLTEAASSSLTASSSSAAAAAAPPPPLSFSSSAAAGCPVRCEGCVRLQTRFVVLGCAHTFCWGCVAAAAWGQRRSVERQASRGGLDAWDGGWGGAGSAHVAAAAAAAANAAGGGSGSGSGSGGRGGVAAAAAAAVADSEAAEVAEAAAAAADPPPPTGDGAPDAPPPSSKAGGPGWGGLSARFAALPPLATPEAGGDGSQPPQPAPQHPPPASPRAAAAAPAGGGHAATLTCPVCDAVADLEKGHLEVNSLVSDDAFLWLLSRDGERSGGRRHSSRSLLAGIDFASSAWPAGAPSSHLPPSREYSPFHMTHVRFLCPAQCPCKGPPARTRGRCTRPPPGWAASTRGAPSRCPSRRRGERSTTKNRESDTCSSTGGGRKRAWRGRACFALVLAG